jgi:hypothetical protein
MKRKILFLDIDGVINTLCTQAQANSTQFNVDKDCLFRLKHLVESLDIKLVLSSTWRYGGMGYAKGLDLVLDVFREAGWTDPPFIGYTPDLSQKTENLWQAKSRGEECLAWMRERYQDGDTYVAVDDYNDFSGFVGKVVLVHPSFGLVQEDCDLITKYFSI